MRFHWHFQTKSVTIRVAKTGKLKDSFKLYGNNLIPILNLKDLMTEKDKNFAGKYLEIIHALSSILNISIQPVIYCFICWMEQNPVRQDKHYSRNISLPPVHWGGTIFRLPAERNIRTRSRLTTFFCMFLQNSLHQKFMSISTSNVCKVL